MNETIRLLNSHQSIRNFTEQPVTQEQLQTIISAAQRASSSSNVQAYSVIHITDEDKRKQIAEWADNQAHISKSPVFLVWCADLYRLREAYSMHEDPGQAYLGTTENWIVATVDAALAAQNAAIAAESLGMGIVYIGAIRNRIEAVSELLGLPAYTSPLFGMCIGYPNQNPGQKPRLPQQAILHHNTYQTDGVVEQITDYDNTMMDYIMKRTGGKRSNGWSEDMRNKLKAPSRLDIKSYLNGQGLDKE
ncbi:oxygen-insensitive NADPH nitroreductase [Paenibacillus agricola]|uniref:Oxygen-insensitive NADPH nitroreductase n=1 Tax=Paenibacillus agricola TaxID=2716264 RepID=A0ABX0JBZ6_9BACL|nr:oxygen-insensitive NADPH nitroreductase [Paenibacillus agricola]NHN33078.1 oxygen-insensitive NADPH nitroreductase [Paenibacillus agricola]